MAAVDPESNLRAMGAGSVIEEWKGFRMNDLLETG
jgi:hypothetical protein